MPGERFWARHFARLHRDTGAMPSHVRTIAATRGLRSQFVGAALARFSIDMDRTASVHRSMAM